MPECGSGNVVQLLMCRLAFPIICAAGIEALCTTSTLLTAVKKDIRIIDAGVRSNERMTRLL